MEVKPRFSPMPAATAADLCATTATTSNGHGVPSVEELAQKIVEEMMRVSALYDGTWKYLDFENMIFEREVWEDGDPGPEQYYFNCIWSYVGFEDSDLQTFLEWQNEDGAKYVQFENYIKDVFPDLWRDTVSSERDYDLDHH